MDLNDKAVLITGGTGSFGRAFTRYIDKKYTPKKLIIYSRDESKQYLMQQEFNKDYMRYYIGNVRDPDRLNWALNGVDFVIHAAILKHPETVESNPFEAIETNIIGARNLIKAAIYNGVEKVISLSNTKAVNPVDLFGATKLCEEKVFIASNRFLRSDKQTKFSIVRYANIFGSSSSLLHQFLSMKEKGILSIYDFRMTRFFLKMEESVSFVLKCLGKMEGGEIFVPKIPSMRVTDLARAVCPKCKQEIMGIAPGEKLHEILIGKEESKNTAEFKEYYVVYPESWTWKDKDFFKYGVKRVPDDFEFRSDENTEWISTREIKEILEKR